MGHTPLSIRGLQFFPLVLTLDQFAAAFDKPQALISEETLAERNAVRKDHIIELSSTYKGSSGGIQIHGHKGNESRRNVSSRTLSARVGSFSAVHHNKKQGMVLPFTPLSITFDEIRYAVDMPQENNRLCSRKNHYIRISGYCEQTDIHSPHVTVYESLVYSAWLRLPPEVDSSTRQVLDHSIENLR
ncbi:unnamed protein product [Lupinus luteus]|uniref:Uncharacterized protein n=1 Tax=Lupinus luteus TaxID=3873 RepID=A0AAV1XV76_LUPLU